MFEFVENFLDLEITVLVVIMEVIVMKDTCVARHH